MTVDATATAARVLARHARGAASLEELARALKSTGDMHLLVAPDDLLRLTETGEAPELFGAPTPDGFLPFVYTTPDLAHRGALHNGWARPGDATATITRAWLLGLWEFLSDNLAGVVVDHGSDHEVYLTNPRTALLFALMTVEELGALEELWAVCDGGRVVLQHDPRGHAQVYAFDSEEGAELGEQLMREHLPGCEARPLGTGELLGLLIEHDVALLVVNPRLADERSYPRRHFERMLLAYEAR